MSIKILVVDDNSDILANVAEYLEMKGWIVECSLTSADAWERVHRSDIDLMILDVGLPGMDGMTLCRRLRSEGKTLPILMLTARDAIDDRFDGLMAGADDYLVKPFALRELAARVETLLRRTLGATNSTLTVGPLTMNLRTLKVTRNQIPIKLNPTCLKILRSLMSRSPAIVSRAQLELEIWPNDQPMSDSLRSNLYLLRQAIDKPFENEGALLHTHQGFGWSIEAPEVKTEIEPEAKSEAQNSPPPLPPEVSQCFSRATPTQSGSSVVSPTPSFC